MVSFPDFLKVANVILLHKKVEKLDFDNYRPISLLSNINILGVENNVVEKSIIQLTKYLKWYFILFTNLL